MGGGESFVLEIKAGGGSSASGNPGGKGLKRCPSIGGVCIFSGITQYHLKALHIY